MVLLTRLSSCDKVSFGPLLKFVSWRLIFQKVCLVKDHCLLLYSSFLDSISHTQRKKNTTKAKNIEFRYRKFPWKCLLHVHFVITLFSNFFLTKMWFSCLCVCYCKKMRKRSHATNEKKLWKKRHAVDLRKPKYHLSALNSNASKRHQSELISMKRLS